MLLINAAPRNAAQARKRHWQWPFERHAAPGPFPGLLTAEAAASKLKPSCGHRPPPAQCQRQGHLESRWNHDVEWSLPGGSISSASCAPAIVNMHRSSATVAAMRFLSACLQGCRCSLSRPRPEVTDHEQNHAAAASCACVVACASKKTNCPKPSSLSCLRHAQSS